jgi:hypothetical protein
VADPKVGTGKKPKGSGRRLYTDENPRDTVRIKFATPTDARNTVASSDLKEGPYKKKLVKGLMSARRDVGKALKKKDKKMERSARNRVHKFKVKLGERNA